MDKQVELFLAYAQIQARSYTTNNIILTMGEDFNYQIAEMWFKNMDKLIKWVCQRLLFLIAFFLPSEWQAVQLYNIIFFRETNGINERGKKVKSFSCFTGTSMNATAPTTTLFTPRRRVTWRHWTTRRNRGQWRPTISSPTPAIRTPTGLATSRRGPLWSTTREWAITFCRWVLVLLHWNLTSVELLLFFFCFAEDRQAIVSDEWHRVECELGSLPWGDGRDATSRCRDRNGEAISGQWLCQIAVAEHGSWS